MITKIKSKAWVVFYSAVSMIECQVLSLAYRYAVIHENRDVYHTFMSKKFQTFLILFTQLVAIGFAYAFVGGIVKEEVL
jgi:hypothetical protein